MLLKTAITNHLSHCAQGVRLCMLCSRWFRHGDGAILAEAILAEAILAEAILAEAILAEAILTGYSG